jgi:hypothetical protein
VRPETPTAWAEPMIACKRNSCVSRMGTASVYQAHRKGAKEGTRAPSEGNGEVCLARVGLRTAPRPHFVRTTLPSEGRCKSIRVLPLRRALCRGAAPSPVTPRSGRHAAPSNSAIACGTCHQIAGARWHRHC